MGAVSICLVCMFGTFVATLPSYLDSTAFCHVSNAPCGAAGSFYGTDVVKDHECGPFISCVNTLTPGTTGSGSCEFSMSGCTRTGASSPIGCLRLCGLPFAVLATCLGLRT